jgi:MFS family permease
LQWVLTGYLLALASLILLVCTRRSLWPAEDLLDRHDLVRRGVVAVRTCTEHRSTRDGPRAGGCWRRLLTPGSLAILQASFKQSDRAKAVSAWSGLSGAAGAIGPFVGGWLVDGPGWRWAFLLSVPVAVVVVACALVAVPETRDPHDAHGLDIVGAAFGVVSLGAATWALTEAGPRGWTDGAVLLAGGIAVAGMAAFVYRTRHAKDPLVPPALFRSREFTVTNLATVLLYAAIGVTFFLVAYELQVAMGWSALRAGVTLLPTTILMLLFSARSGELAPRVGPRLQLTVGPSPPDCSFSVALVRTSLGPCDVLPGAIVFGLGLATFVAPLTAAVMGSVSLDEVSIASGVNNTIARTASVAALSVIPVVSGCSTPPELPGSPTPFAPPSSSPRSSPRRLHRSASSASTPTCAPEVRPAAPTAPSTDRHSNPTQPVAR